MEDVKEDFGVAYIVTTPFTGNEEEIAATFIMDSAETEADENSCILTDEGNILVQNVCDVTDKEYTQTVDKEYMWTKSTHKLWTKSTHKLQSQIFNRTKR
ncbi:hypothetical protein JTE90_018345 [Oedothorax gibbosus]|uniref:Lipocalin/cytosolic fatty-acid binding domain-containing protein n=1 Tax=Oedothorax gibbosus TaxID=931172 RepID=A0AAV6U073_9ARAC|nr:hypothetical protein JTE90_018345 [Oedothorax gibbosus]